MARVANPDRADHWVKENHNRHAGTDKRQRQGKRRHRRREHSRLGREMVERLGDGARLRRLKGE